MKPAAPEHSAAFAKNPVQPDATATTASDGNQQQADVLIVGQGIAGSLLAWTLLEHGLSVRVVDDGHKTCASVAAAGMVNPVIGQRLNKAWEIEQCLPVAKALFARLEKHFSQKFFFPKKILRIINTEKEAEFLQKRLSDPTFAPFLGTLHPPHHHSRAANTATPANTASTADTATDNSTSTTNSANATKLAANTLRDEFGSIEIIGGGYLDTIALLGALREYFCANGILIEAPFDHSELQLCGQADSGQTVSGQTVSGLADCHSHSDGNQQAQGNPKCAGALWRGLRVRRVIFAEGWRVLQNPFFSAYSFQATKGQILTVRAGHPLPDFVVNRAKWLIPQSETEAWIGSTYERDQTDPTPTPEGAAEIFNRVQNFMPGNPLQIAGHRAGIRLASYDHVPRVGFLPQENRIGLFNAFSSKGNCFVPYLARCVAEHLIDGTALPPRADIARKKTRKGDATNRTN